MRSKMNKCGGKAIIELIAVRAFPLYLTMCELVDQWRLERLAIISYLQKNKALIWETC